MRRLFNVVIEYLRQSDWRLWWQTTTATTIQVEKMISSTKKLSEKRSLCVYLLYHTDNIESEKSWKKSEQRRTQTRKEGKKVKRRSIFLRQHNFRGKVLEVVAKTAKPTVRGWLRLPKWLLEYRHHHEEEVSCLQETSETLIEKRDLKKDLQKDLHLKVVLLHFSHFEVFRLKNWKYISLLISRERALVVMQCVFSFSWKGDERLGDMRWWQRFRESA